MAEVCGRYGASLIVDEAHATGVFGKRGEGKVVELGLENKVFARVHTFGKALGAHGAIVLGSSTLRSYLINFARSFIYTTALPFHSLASIRSAYALLKSDTEQMSGLREKVKFFKMRIGSETVGTMIPSESAIQCVVIPGNSKVKAIARAIQESGLDVRAIMHPTVPSGAERLRICLHSFNTEEEIENLTNRLGALSQ
jgi:8-amino-7-oxononanoate synthase